MYPYAYVYAYLYINIYMYLYKYKYKLYMYTYTYMYIYVYMHTHTLCLLCHFTSWEHYIDLQQTIQYVQYFSIYSKSPCRFLHTSPIWIVRNTTSHFILECISTLLQQVRALGNMPRNHQTSSGDKSSCPRHNSCIFPRWQGISHAFLQLWPHGTQPFWDPANNNYFTPS
jgi:hypothetical protein